jgi:hypothetical protein
MVRTFPAQLNGMSNSFCESVCCFFVWKGELAGLSLFFTVTPSRLLPGKSYSTPLYLLGGDFVPRRSLFACAHRHG